MYYLLREVTPEYTSYAIMSETAVGYFKAKLAKSIDSFNTKPSTYIKAKLDLQDYLNAYDYMELDVESPTLANIQQAYPELFI